MPSTKPPVGDVVLQIEDLCTYFETDEGVVKAVDGVSLAVRRGEILGLVGESGSGKSVTNLSVLRLVPSPPGKHAGGHVWFRGVDLTALPEPEMRKYRGNRIAMIFQDPMTSLNPYLRVGRQISEVLRLHKGLTRKAAWERAIELLQLVGIPAPERRVDQHPHELSGGMRQRVMIAMALACEPELLLADEPTTALDVTIQAQILELIRKLTDRLGTAVILVTHDLGVVAGVSDFLAVMYAGRVVERGPTGEVFARPRHPYTQGLLASLPRLDSDAELTPIEGRPPDLRDVGPGCAFAPRCPQAHARCAIQPPWFGSPTRGAACWLEAP
ncbi:MAG: ABC transporter ATP-binding protein [Alphaproteobacteria bacterium]|nr:ABC transporter ATP-binding protein [Alphaproteobacteria bacterium]